MTSSGSRRTVLKRLLTAGGAECVPVGVYEFLRGALRRDLVLLSAESNPDARRQTPNLQLRSYRRAKNQRRSEAPEQAQRSAADQPHRAEAR